MLKSLIWFNDINLWNECEIEASKRELVGAADFVTESIVNFMIKIYAEKYQKIIDEKHFKKTVNLWLALKKEADAQNKTIAELMESIAYEAIHPTPEKQPEEAKKTVMQRLGAAMALPTG